MARARKNAGGGKKAAKIATAEAGGTGTTNTPPHPSGTGNENPLTKANPKADEVNESRRSQRNRNRNPPLSEEQQIDVLPVVQEQEEEGEGAGREVEPEHVDAEHDRDASPTTSEGPEFQLTSTAPAIDLRASRRSRNAPLGFSNSGHLCYRNSLLVTLFHSDRIMQWLKYRYVPELTLAGLKLSNFRNWSTSSQMRTKINKDARQASDVDYTDVLYELFDLSQIYWGPWDQKLLDQRMKFFWSFLTLECTKYKSEDGPPWDFRQQEDPAGLLRFLVDMARFERNRLVHGKMCPNLLPEERARLESILDLDISNIIGFKKTKRANCVYCSRAFNTKRRIERTDEESIWPIPALKPRMATEGDQFEPEVDLADCLVRSLKSEFEGATCDACKEITNAIRDKFSKEREKISSAKAQNKNKKAAALAEVQNRQDQELKNLRVCNGYTWERIAKLPEVLFLTLTRFPGYGQNKRAVVVNIPPTLDLQGMVEHRVTMPKETKYRIVGVVCHKGHTLNFGHYIAYTLTKEDGWKEYNDKNVAETTLDAIINGQRDPIETALTPYLIMYQKIPVDEFNEGLEAEQTPDTSGKTVQSCDIRNSGAQVATIEGRPTLKTPNEPDSLLEIATKSIPGPGEGYMTIDVRLNTTTIQFPSFVLKNHSNSKVRLSNVRMGLFDAKGHVHLDARQIRDASAIPSGSSKRSSDQCLQSNDGDENAGSPSKRRKGDTPPRDEQLKTKTPEGPRRSPTTKRNSNEGGQGACDTSPARGTRHSTIPRRATTPATDHRDDSSSSPDIIFMALSPPASPGLRLASHSPISPPPSFSDPPYVEYYRAQNATTPTHDADDVHEHNSISQGSSGPNVPNASPTPNAHVAHAGAGLWGDGQIDDEDDADPFATTWEHLRLSPTRRPLYSPGNSMFRNFSDSPWYWESNSGLDSPRAVDMQSFRHRKRRRMSYNSNGDADNESTVESSPPSAASDFGYGTREYHDNSQVRPAGRPLYLSPGMEPYEIVERRDIYYTEDEERAIILGMDEDGMDDADMDMGMDMDMDMDMGVGPEAVPRRWRGYV